MSNDDVEYNRDYKRPLQEFHSRSDKTSNHNTVAFVTPPCHSHSNESASSKVDIDDDNDDKNHSIYNECNKRLRYTTELADSKADGYSCGHPNGIRTPLPLLPHPQMSCTITAFPMETASTTMTTENSKPPSIPWWIQQQQQRSVSAPPTIPRSTAATCRICQRQYVGQPPMHDINHDASTNDTNSSFSNNNCARKVVSSPRSNHSTKTLLSYFPLKSILADNDKKPRSISSPTKEQHRDTRNNNDTNHNRNNIGVTPTRCRFCERDDFCRQCPPQACTTCFHHFCYFCRTLQQNGEIQCIDCYSATSGSSHKKKVMEPHAQQRPQHHDEMDID